VLQTPQTNLVMDKNTSVDRRLGEKSFGLGMFHARSDGDVHGGVSIHICLVPTVGAFENGSIPYAFASASGTGVRCSSGIDRYHKPIVGFLGGSV